MENASLKKMLALDVPSGFLTNITKQLSLIYPNAFAEVYNNSELGKPEAEYLLGHQRRAMCESAFRNIALKHYLSVEMKRSEKGWCQHVQITTGRIRMALCHVQSAGAFPKFSTSREQYSKINQHIDQFQLFPVDSTPLESEIFGILVHTEAQKKDQFGYAGIGFPNENFTEWATKPIDIWDVIDIQTDLAKQVVEVDLSEEATPLFKNKIKPKEEGE